MIVSSGEQASMHIEVLICSHNRGSLLNNALMSLNDTIKPADCHISITVAANACSDNTHQILKNYQKQQKSKKLHCLVWHEVSTPGKSYALNYVCPRLKGDLIAMVDDDHQISKKYFIVLANAYIQFPEMGIFFGKILPDWNGKEPEWAHESGKYAIFPLPVPCYDKGDEGFEFESQVSLPGGGNLALKKDVFHRVGNFNTELGPSGHNLGGGEDSDFILRSVEGGERLRYLPDMVQYHYVDLERFRLSYMLLKSFQRTRSVISIRNKEATKTPLYLWRKLVSHCLKIFFSLSIKRSRFYLVRFAATLGEVSGFRQVVKLNISKKIKDN